jgi:hypothetical protein
MTKRELLRWQRKRDDRRARGLPVDDLWREFREATKDDPFPEAPSEAEEAANPQLGADWLRSVRAWGERHGMKPPKKPASVRKFEEELRRKRTTDERQ